MRSEPGRASFAGSPADLDGPRAVAERAFRAATMAMKIIAPGEDVGWIRRPHSISVYALLPKVKRPILVPDGRELFTWGLQMMDVAAAGTDKASRIAYRDGLLVAMLAARGRRIRSMTLLRVGHELIAREGRYRIELTLDQVKTKKHDRFYLLERLTPYVRHSLEVVRPARLEGQDHDALWANPNGGSMTLKAIQHRIVKLTRQRFDIGFGPHRFPHAIATTAALRDPASPGLAAGVLGGSAAMIEQHYNRAGQIQAARKYAQMLEQRRRDLGSQAGH